VRQSQGDQSSGRLIPLGSIQRLTLRSRIENEIHSIARPPGALCFLLIFSNGGSGIYGRGRRPNHSHARSIFVTIVCIAVVEAARPPNQFEL
jgi:hypothetical protein